MDERSHASQPQGGSTVLVGAFADRQAGLEELEPAIGDLGWNIVEFDPSGLDPSGPIETDRLAGFDLIVFNLESVGTDTLEKVAETSLFAPAKVLVISEDRDPQVIADVLRSGADDYLVSPFETPELAARMYSLVTRVWPSTDRRVSRRIAFDFDTRSIAAGPYSVRFTPLEWDVLCVLMEHDGDPIPAGSVVHELDFRTLQPSTIPTVISRIRRKLAANSFEAISVTTVQNRGYVAQFRRSSDHWNHSDRPKCEPTSGQPGWPSAPHAASRSGRSSDLISGMN